MPERLSNLFSWYSLHMRKIIYYTCLFTLAIVFLERLFIIFSYEAHTAGIDNNFDYPIIRSLAGFSIYPDPTEYPYAVNPYAPLFFIICKWVAVLLRLTAEDTIAIYRVSRSVCLLADTATCLLLFKMLRTCARGSRIVAVACTTIFFTIVSYLGYTINRADALFLFFFASVFFMLLRLSSKKNAGQAVLLAALVTLCIFSKQNGISLLVLVPAWLLLERNYRQLLLFVCCTVLFFAGAYLYFERVYTNHFFSDHIINALKNKIDPRWFYVYVLKLISSTYLTLPLLLSLVVAVQGIAVNKNPLLTKLGIVFILQFFFSTALAFKWGSSLGYYNESFFLCFILLTTFYNSDAGPKISGFIHIPAMYTYPAFCLLLFHMVAQLFFFFINSRAETHQKYNEQVQIANYLKSAIGAQDKYVMDLSNPDFNFFKNLLYKESAAPNMDAVSCCTLPDSIFNYSGLTNGLINGKIAFLIENKTVAEKTKWGIDLGRYQPDTSFSNYRIYKFDSLKSAQ